jgi:glucokinase
MTGQGECGLIADIGGTNARFALVYDKAPGWQHERRLKVAEHASLEDAVKAYLADVAAKCAADQASPPSQGAFCVACPVTSDAVRLTNNSWAFSISETQASLGFRHLAVVNDFVGNALACPELGYDSLFPIGGGLPQQGFPVAVIGPGTGLGVALMIPQQDGSWLPIATEGGHVTLAATSDEQALILAKARASHGHISAERLISGPGLSLLYKLVSNSEQRLAPPEISARALAGADLHATRALSLFCEFLGSTCGNLALTSGALGGVMLMGGILPGMLGFLADSPFRTAFEAKGRFNTYLSKIPTQVVTHPYPAFVGLEHLIRFSALGAAS